MNDGDIRAIIRQELREALAPIMMGLIVSNESNLRSSIRRMAAEGPISNLRNIQSYGLASSAPKNTDCLSIPISGDPTHINVVGHFDKNKPTTNDGESILYDAYGHIVYLSENKMQFGSKSSENPMMLGDIVQELLSSILEKIAQHQHIGNLGYLTGVPNNAADFTALKSSPVDDGAIISDKCFTEK